MTTIVVHGTLAYGGSWYQNSWGERGFLAGLRSGMVKADGRHDIWNAEGKSVDVFKWNGLPEGLYRGIAASSLADYLNTVSDLSDEPIRVIAHSHGCNVVKLASSLPSLSPHVTIEKAVFLAGPHFYEDEYTQEGLSGLDRFDIRKVNKAYKKTGHRFRYALDPDRFGRILNVYCKKDKVQVDLAQSFSGGQMPLTGSFLENVMMQFSSGMHEAPKSSRHEMDKNAVDLYEDLEVFVEKGCGGIETHSVMHGSIIGELAGVWLNCHTSIHELLDEFGSPPILPCDDVGA